MSTHSTMVASLVELANRPVELGVTRVVMKATSDYRRAPFYLLEAHGLAPCWSMPRTSSICPVAEDRRAGLGVVVQDRRTADAAPSFVPERDIRQLRDLTRYRVDLVGARNAKKNRVEKLLEDEQHFEPGDHERFSHYVKKEKILESALTGKPVRALCGKKWTPGRDPEKFPICPTCKEIYESMVA